MRKRPQLILAGAVLMALLPIAALYMTGTRSGIQVRWHLREWDTGRLNMRITMIVRPECYVSVTHGYRLGLFDLFTFRREPPPLELRATNDFPSFGSEILDLSSSQEIWSEVAKGIGDTTNSWKPHVSAPVSWSITNSVAR